MNSPLGSIQKLKVARKASVGAYLDAGDELGEVLLPNKEAPENVQLGDEVEVFVYHDSEDRLVASQTLPHATVGEFAYLRVKEVNQIGAFLDWGLPKDLLLPFGEQKGQLEPGDDVIVYIDIDRSGRISATQRIEANTQKSPMGLEAGQAVELLIFGKSDLGYKAIVNGANLGLLYKNEVFQPLQYGQFVEGFIKSIRDDGKIDLSLQDPSSKGGHRAQRDDISAKILASLREAGGFLAINDKTPAEEIYEKFGVSKKKYKIALGGLYKSRLILVTDEGIQLTAQAGDN